MPLADGLAGTLVATARLLEASLGLLEAGLMYYAAGEAQTVTALRYPTFRAQDESDTPLDSQTSLDVLSPLDPDRTNSQSTDSSVGSHFGSPAGKPFSFSITPGAPSGAASRLVLAGRPTSPTGPVTYDRLAPAGRFPLSLGGRGSSDAVGTAPTRSPMARRPEWCCSVPATST